MDQPLNCSVPVMSQVCNCLSPVTVSGELWHFGDKGDRGLQDQEAVGSTDSVLFIVSILFIIQSTVKASSHNYIFIYSPSLLPLYMSGRQTGLCGQLPLSRLPHLELLPPNQESISLPGEEVRRLRKRPSDAMEDKCLQHIEIQLWLNSAGLVG